MSLSIKSILKESILFNIVGVITKLIMGLAMIYAAKHIGAEDYGIYGILLLWTQYMGLIKPGFVSQVTREIPVLEKLKQDYIRPQNIAISGELIFMVLPFIIFLMSSFLYDEAKIKISLLILAFLTIFIRLNEIWSSIILVRKQFNKVAVGRLIYGISGPALIFLLTKEFGIYILVVFSGVSALISFIFYNYYVKINFNFEIDFLKLKTLFKDGIILQLLVISFWAFRLSDRTMISMYLDLESLGLYTFAANLVLFLKNFVGEFHTVLQPIAWGEIHKKSKKSFKDLLKTTYFIAIISFVFIPISQFFFYLIVNFYSKDFIEAAPVFNILSTSTYFIAIGGTVGIILNSETIKKYKLSLYYSLFGLFINILIDYILIINGYGIFSIALATLIVQSFVSVIQFIHVKEYMFSDYRELILFYLKILTPFIMLFSILYIFGESFTIKNINDGLLLILFSITVSSVYFLTNKKYFLEN